MVRFTWISMVLLVSLGWVPVSAMAAESDSTASSTKSAPAPMGTAAPADAMTTGTDSSAQDQAPAPIAPTGTDTAAAPIPALKPIVITFSGDLSAIDAAASPASMTVQDRYGVRKEIAVPADAKILQGTMSKAVTDLKVGDKLTVEYTYDVATGKRTAQSIAIGGEAAVSKPATTQ